MKSLLKFLTHKVYLLYFVSYFLIAQFVLGNTLQSDFLLFFNWKLFAHKKSNYTYELKSKEQYLLKSDIIKNKSLKHKVYHNLMIQNYDWLRKKKEWIKQQCQCSDITVVRLHINNVDYFLNNIEPTQVDVMVKL